MNPRRELTATFVGALAAAGLLFWSVSERWASGRGTASYAQIVQHQHVSGRSAAPLVAAAALVAVAGALAIPATKRIGRSLAGGLLIVAGVVAVVEALLRRTSAERDLRAKLTGDVVTNATGWPYLAVAAGVLLTLVGLVLAIRGPRWQALSARYEVPAARREKVAAPGDAGTWDALDRGEDPTAATPEATP